MPICLPIPDDKLIDDDGAECWFTDDVTPCMPGKPKPGEVGMSACSGTCFVPDSPGTTEVGAVFISTKSTAGTEPTIEMYAIRFTSSSNLLVL